MLKISGNECSTLPVQNIVQVLFALWLLLLRFMLVIYDFYCQSKLLIKIQLYVIQLQTGLFFFSLSPSLCVYVCVCMSSPVMYWIYSSSNYEIGGYRSIILSSHATQTSFWGYSEVTADAVTYLSVLRYENTDGFHSAWDADISRLFHSKILSGSFDVPQLAF